MIDLAISRTQMYRKFKTILNTTPNNFILSFRIQQTETMLIQTNKTIGEIMLACGFKNKAYFYRSFQEKNHLTPTQWRLQFRKR